MMEKNIDLNFLFNNSLWNEKIKILREYIRLKYLVFFYQPELLNNTEFNTIDDEIIKLKDLLNKIKINIPEIIESQNKKINNININNSIEENPILKKLNSIIPNKYSSIQYYKNYENLTSDALYEKLKEKGISDELKKIIREILFSRIIKK